MGTLILLLGFGVPLLIAGGLVYWFLGKPERDARRLQERAESGDPEATAAADRLRKAEAAMKRILGAKDPERERILATGTPARAVVVKMQPLGMDVTAGPIPMQMIEVVLTLEGPGFSRTVRVVDGVSEPLLGRLLKGSTVPVRVDPRGGDGVVVLWDTL